MNVFIITTEDPFYTKPLLEKLHSKFGKQIVGVALVEGFIHRKRIISSLFVYGLFHFVRMAIQTIWSDLKGGVVKTFLKRKEIDCYPVKDVNSDEFVELLKGLEVDILVSNNCPKLIKKKTLGMAREMAINLHLGDLPRYRGVFPLWRAWVNCETHFGVTVHKMDHRFDNGAILCKRHIPIGWEDGLFDLYPKAFAPGAELLCDAILKITTGTVKFSENDSCRMTYYGFPSPREVVRLENQRRKRCAHAASDT